MDAPSSFVGWSCVSVCWMCVTRSSRLWIGAVLDVKTVDSIACIGLGSHPHLSCRFVSLKNDLSVPSPPNLSCRDWLELTSGTEDGRFTSLAKLCANWVLVFLHSLIRVVLIFGNAEGNTVYDNCIWENKWAMILQARRESCVTGFGISSSKREHWWLQNGESRPALLFFIDSSLLIGCH